MTDSWQHVAALDAAGLDALLEHGRPEQRVWAIWELALRAGSSISDVVQRTAREPNPGVRRHLTIVLASHGEVDLLVALGRHDPASEVRASAMQLVTRVAVGGTIDHAVVTESFAREGFAVRAAILGAIGPGSPAAFVSLAADTLDHGDHDEQLEAFEVMLRIASPAEMARAIRWIAKAKDALAARAWMRWRQLVPVPALVAVLALTPLAFRTHALRELGEVPIDELTALTEGADQRMYDAIRQRTDFASTPPEILARAILEGCAAGYLEAMTAKLPRVKLPPELLTELRDHCDRRLAALAGGAQALPDEKPQHRWPARYHYNALRTQLVRALA